MAYPISDVPRRIVYSGSAGVGPYAFTFEVLAATDIAVYKNGTLLTLTTDYTVSINTGTGTGTVTLVVAATGSDQITLVGDRAIERTSDFVTGGDLFANTLNTELDSLTIFAQQVDEKADRAIKAPVTDPTTINMTLPAQATRANKALGFGSNGNPASSINTLAAIDAAVTTVQTLAGAAPGSSAGISHIASGTGAVATTVQTKLRETVSVKDFGAVGDGVTDDTAAIQACLDAAPSGSAIYFPRGKYVVSSTLSTGNKTLLICGDGYRASVGAYFGTASLANKDLYDGTVIFSSVSSGVAFDLNPTSSWAIHLRDMAIVGPGSGTSTGIRARSAQVGNTLVGCVWVNVGVFNFYDGVDLQAVLNGNFTRLRVVGISNYGLAIRAYSAVGSNNNTFTDLETYFTSTYAVYVYDCAGNRFFGPLIQNTPDGQYGIFFDGSAPNNNNDNLIVNPWMEHGSGSAGVLSVYVASGRNTQVLSFHGGTRATIRFAGGTGHQLLGRTRFTFTGTCFTIDSAAEECVYDTREIDQDGGGTVSDSGTRSVDKAVLPAETYANISTSTSGINTVDKYAGKVIWDSTNRRAMRAEGVNPTDRWYDTAAPFFVQPGASGASAGGQVFLVGSGSPEASKAAPIGALYCNTSSGGSSNTFWVKSANSGTVAAPSNTGWEPLMSAPLDQSAANIASVAAAINTTDKRAGKYVWDTTNNRMMRASGSAAADPWYVVDGSTSVTPA